MHTKHKNKQPQSIDTDPSDILEIIKQKFGSLQRFYKISEPNMSYSTVRAVLYGNPEYYSVKRKQQLNTIYDLAMNNFDKILEDEVSSKERKELELKIKRYWYNISRFARLNDINYHPLICLINGERKKKNKEYYQAVELIKKKEEQERKDGIV